MNTTITATDNTWMAFLNAFLNNPFLVTILIFLLWITYLIYKDKTAFFDFLRALVFMKKKRKKITKDDLLKHSFFSDMDFWIDQRIAQLYTGEESKKFDHAKLLIARDVLLIKFKHAKHWVQCFVENTNFEDPYINIRSIMEHKIEKHKSQEYQDFKKEGIPELFLEKFFEISKIHTNYVLHSIDDILEDDVTLSNYEKIYLILNFLSSYYSIKLIEMRNVIQSINGDLKGLVYKGLVIGGNDYHKYPVPNSDYVSIVSERLKELSITTKASRACICLFHDVPGDDFFKGRFSKIYEYCSKGLAESLQNFQYKPVSYISELIVKSKQHEGSCYTLSELNDVLQGLLVTNGIKAIFIYPIFLKGELKGFLGLEYISIEVYNSLKKEEVFEIMKKYASLLNIYLDYRKDGFNYDSMKNTGI